MSWYKRGCEKPKIDYSKPIMAETGGGTLCLLLPCLGKVRNYEIVGYNWFNLEEGDWNSCAFFDTPEQAIRAYSNARNVVLNVEEL